MDAKPLKVDMALLRVAFANRVPVLLVGVLLGPLVLAGCMGNDSEGTPTVFLPIPNLASYAPDPIEIARGETLQWVNEDDSVHTASHDANETAFHTGTLSGGVSSQVFRFLVPGEYTYQCRVHPETMEGTVVVTE